MGCDSGGPGRGHSVLKRDSDMKPKRPTKSKALQPAKPGFDGLLRDLRDFITESRR